LCSSCGVFGPSAKRQGDDQGSDVVKGTPDRPEIIVDTIEWIMVPESESPPITERSDVHLTEYKDLYNIVLLAPFGARQLQSDIDRPSARMVRMIEFLAGLQYGIDFCLRDVNVRLRVIDTEQDPQFESKLDQIDDLKDADIIIGPYFTNQVEAVSQFARQEKKILISPWNTSDLQSANPAYIQLRPSLKSHAKRLTNFAQSIFSKDQIMLLTKNEQRDIEALSFFQDQIDNQSSGDSIREKIIVDIGNSELTDSLAMYIQEQGYRSFIIPEWQDEPFVIAALSKLNFAKYEEHISVLGLPQWMELSRLDYDYCDKLQVHLSSARPGADTS
jgi:predicted dinucleotide-binding enzyme